MKRCVAFAFVVAAIAACAIPSARAQRGGAHAGFSAHAAPASRGSFSGAARPGNFPSAGPRIASRPSIPGRIAVVPRAAFRPQPLASPRIAAQRVPLARVSPDRYRDRFRTAYNRTVVYGAAGWPAWFAPYLWAYPEYYGDTTPYLTNEEREPYAAYPGPYDYPPQQDLAQAEPPVWMPPSQQTASDQPAVTLLFRDGRAPLQVKNFMVTDANLFELDSPHREIPLADLDLPATEKANREAGVDFRVPGAAGE